MFYTKTMVIVSPPLLLYVVCSEIKYTLTKRSCHTSSEHCQSILCLFSNCYWTSQNM